MYKLIGVIRFDSITTFEEFQQIITKLLGLGFELEIGKRLNTTLAEHEAWQVIIRKRDNTA